MLVNDQGILRKGRRGRGGVARIECLRECRDETGDRLFIVAKFAGRVPAERGLSVRRRLLGTQAWASPEQKRDQQQTDGSHSCHSSSIEVRGQQPRCPGPSNA